MKKWKHIKVIILFTVTAAACLIAFFMNMQQLDVMYTSVFYIPMILMGVWYYRKVVPLTILFVALFLFMDFKAPKPEFVRVEQLFRGLILVAGAFLFYFMGRQLEESRKQLAIEKERFRITLLSIGDGVISTDRMGKLTFINDVARKLTGWEGDAALGRPFGEVFRIVNEYTGASCEDPVEKVLSSGEVVSLANHTVLIAKDGAETPVADSAAPIRDDTGELHGVVMVFRDVTAEKAQRDRVEYQSLHDQLTGLGNRRFLDMQTKRLERESPLPLSVIVGDVNGLKLTNDAIGHEMGDMLLKQAADTWKSVLRDSDIICRYGGDEFVVLLPGMDGDETGRIVERLRDAFRGITVGSIRLSISLGWAVKSDEAESYMNVFRAAEDRMYAGKLTESIETKRDIIESLIRKSEPNPRRTERIRDLTVQAFHLTGREAEDFRTAFMVRDIGRAVIIETGGEEASPWHADEENHTVKRHAEVSYRILNMVPEFAAVAHYVLAHHERWDGAGYPNGLAGEAIPYLSRIIAVADYFDSMAASGGAVPTDEEAVAAMTRHAGTRFDPAVARVFVDGVIIDGGRTE